MLGRSVQSRGKGKGVEQDCYGICAQVVREEEICYLNTHAF